MTHPVATSALSHLRVLDLTRVRAGSTYCRILAHFGADVIKIEAPPGVGPRSRLKVSPAGLIYKVDAVFADPQVCHLSMAVPVQDIERGEVRVVGQPIGLSRTPSRVARGIPEQGEHTQKILSEIFYSTDEIAHLRNRKVV